MANPGYPMAKDLECMFKEMQKLLGERSLTGQADRYCYATDSSIYWSLPEIIYPQS